MKQNSLTCVWEKTSDRLPVKTSKLSHFATLDELFAVQARRRPDAVAVEGPDGSMTYSELDRRSERLALRLREAGVTAEVPVGVAMSPGEELLVALLAILKAGGAYVPLDPDYPAARLELMMRRAALKVVLARASVKARLPDTGARWMSPTDSPRSPGVEPGAALPDVVMSDTVVPSARAVAENLAYICYTSGSTGRPKGVCVTHRGAARLVIDTDYIRLRPDDRIAFASNISFDAATFEIWSALLQGATVVVLPRRALLSPDALATTLRAWRVSILFLTTSLFHLLVQEVPGAFSRLRYLLFGGEAADPGRVRELLEGSPPRRLLNVYGPTENTTFSTWHRVREVPADATGVPIGTAIAHSSDHVVDHRLELVTAEEEGELAVGGDGVARGYLRQPRLTAERFVPDPFASGPGARLYRTGDRVVRNTDGAVEFLGRTDRQVKVRGFRIEPGEIETALRGHDFVRQAAVVAVRLTAGEELRLVACLVSDPEQSPDSRSLRRFLSQRLPDYMIPTAFLDFETFILTAHGKLDREKLERIAIERLGPMEPAGRAADRGESALPANPPTELETEISGMWGRLLGMPPAEIDRRASLFELGGTSLVATRLVARLRRRFGVELDFGEFLSRPTVAAVAAAVEAVRDPAVPSPPAGTDSGPQPRRPAPADRLSRFPLSFAQRRVWFLERLVPGSLAYQFQSLLRFEGALERGALAGSLAEIVRRHEILRTSFEPSGEEPVQVIHPPPAFVLPQVDLSGLTPESREIETRRMIRENLRLRFDTTRPPLVRWVLFRLTPTRHWLLHLEHHLLHDGWSFNVLLNELSTLYRAYAAGRPSPLEPPPLQFADFALWQRRFMAGPEARRQTAYWRRKLTPEPPPLELPTDRPRPPVPSTRGDSLRFELAAETANALRRLSRQQGTSLFELLLAAFFAWLRCLSGQSDLCVGYGVANRRWQQTEGLIGMVVNTLVLRTSVDGDLPFHRLLSGVRREVRETQGHQDLPFEKVVEAVSPQRDPGRNPLFQTMFNFHDAPLEELEFPGLELEIEHGLSNGSAKFDMNVIAILPREQGRAGAGQGRAESIHFLWEFSTDLFERSTMEHLVRLYRRLLVAVLADAESRLDDLLELSAADGRVLRRAAAKLDPVTETPPIEHRRAPASMVVDTAGSRQLERRLCALWQDLLSVDHVAPDDNFFDLGGHSLLIIRFERRLREELARTIDVVDLFNHPTPRALARHLEAAVAELEGERDSRRSTERARQRRQRSRRRRSRRTAGGDAGPTEEGTRGAP